jgi:hypothetical protein
MKAFILFFLVTLHLYASTVVTENDPSTLVNKLTIFLLAKTSY